MTDEPDISVAETNPSNPVSSFFQTMVPHMDAGNLYYYEHPRPSRDSDLVATSDAVKALEGLEYPLVPISIEGLDKPAFKVDPVRARRELGLNFDQWDTIVKGVRHYSPSDNIATLFDRTTSIEGTGSVPVKQVLETMLPFIARGDCGRERNLFTGTYYLTVRGEEALAALEQLGLPTEESRLVEEGLRRVPMADLQEKLGLDQEGYGKLLRQLPNFRQAHMGDDIAFPRRGERPADTAAARIGSTPHARVANIPFDQDR